MPRTRIGRVYCPGGRRWLAVVVAVLAACGVAGAIPSAALAGSSSVPTWTIRQHLTARPIARARATMAYDAATGNVVLFGGFGAERIFADTWIWG